jgi:hypothetical protein
MPICFNPDFIAFKHSFRLSPVSIIRFLSEDVFQDLSSKPLKPDHVRKVIWEPALKKVGIKYHPLIQTTHTFATMVIDAKYYSWMKKDTRNDGAAFMRNSYAHVLDPEAKSGEAKADNQADFTPNLHQGRLTPMPHFS